MIKRGNGFKITVHIGRTLGKSVAKKVDMLTSGHEQRLALSNHQQTAAPACVTNL